MDQKNFTIQHSVTAKVFNELFDDGFVDATRDEFEKAYGQAQYLLTRANNEQ